MQSGVLYRVLAFAFVFIFSLLFAPHLAANNMETTMGPSQMDASVIVMSRFYFSGVRSDFMGDGSGILTLQNYTQGLAFTSANFVSFTYTSNQLPSLSIAENPSVKLTGSIPLLLPNFANVNISVNFNVPFSSSSTGNGDWCAGNSCNVDFGSISVWVLPSSVPEPGTLILVGTALAGLGSIRWRKALNSISTKRLCCLESDA
jgi:PEP-CTERM motif